MFKRTNDRPDRLQQNRAAQAQKRQQREQEPSTLQKLGHATHRIYTGIVYVGIPLAVLIAGGTLFLDSYLDENDPRRPANATARFFGDVSAGIENRVRAVTTYWTVKEAEAVEQINRQTTALETELEVRADEVRSRIDQADTQLSATLPKTYFNELACLYVDVNRGGYGGPCAAAENTRARVMNERTRLIGDIKVLYDDDELRDMIGLPKDWEADILGDRS